MVDPEAVLMLFMNGIAFTIGLAGNVHIVVVYLLDWAKRKSLASSEKILCFVGVSNIALAFVLTTDNVFYYTWRGFYSLHSSLVAFFVVQMFLFFCSLWLTAWLCVFYCLKVVNFSHPALLRVKPRISSMVPWLLLVSVVVSLVTSIPVGLSLQKEEPEKLNISVNYGPGSPIGPALSNGTWGTNQSVSSNGMKTTNNTDGAMGSNVKGSPIYRFNNLGPLVVSVLECSLPFAMVLLSCLLLIWSLFGHAKKMRKNSTGFQNHHMDCHLGAVRTVTSLLLLYASFYLAAMAILSGLVPSSGAGNVLCYLTAVMYPAVHSLILILGSSKLKEASRRAIRRLRCQALTENMHSITE
ncbi:taste receptor type 2 member 40-like [Ambystoma mexicanum]|uniref:taste receptor type 2 member 40-like n=1 Tax=Ambystoma mexicanum TaxID=8296 RepID=UPI0037E8085D